MGIDDGLNKGGGRHSADMWQFYKTSRVFRALFGGTRAIEPKDFWRILRLPQEERRYFFRRWSRSARSCLEGPCSRADEAYRPLGDLRRLSWRVGWYDAETVHAMDHPFFFEHPLDHAPAMMLVEAGRQLGIAISHLFLAVPPETMFATRSFEIRFTEFAETTSPVVISASVTDKRFRKGELIHMRMDGYFSQDNRSLGSMVGSWSMLQPAVWRRYRRREQQWAIAG